jgi:hypothetical protein
VRACGSQIKRSSCATLPWAKHERLNERASERASERVNECVTGGEGRVGGREGVGGGDTGKCKWLGARLPPRRTWPFNNRHRIASAPAYSAKRDTEDPPLPPLSSFLLYPSPFLWPSANTTVLITRASHPSLPLLHPTPDTVPLAHCFANDNSTF